MLPRVPQLWILPSWRDELRCCHMSHGSGLCLPERGAPVLTRVPRPPGGLWTTGIKKGLAALGIQLGSHIFKTHSGVTKAPARPASRYSVAVQCNGDPADHSWTWLQWWYDPIGQHWPCSVQQGDEIEQLHASDAVQDIISLLLPITTLDVV
jgi:hypothetical protein